MHVFNIFRMTVSTVFLITLKTMMSAYAVLIKNIPSVSIFPDGFSLWSMAIRK